MTKLSYTPTEAARECGVATDMVKDAVRQRVLPARDAEGSPLVLHADLAVWLLTLPTWDS